MRGVKVFKFSRENPNSVFLTDVVSIMGDQKPVEPPGLESIDLVKMNTGRLKTADNSNNFSNQIKRGVE